MCAACVLRLSHHVGLLVRQMLVDLPDSKRLMHTAGHDTAMACQRHQGHRATPSVPSKCPVQPCSARHAFTHSSSHPGSCMPVQERPSCRCTAAVSLRGTSPPAWYTAACTSRSSTGPV